MKIQTELTQRLQGLNPSYLEVINESSGHGGYYEGKESHFKLVIVGDIFAGLRPVARHQKVYAAVGDLMQNGIHALAIHAYAPHEWTGSAPQSTPCAHARG